MRREIRGMGTNNSARRLPSPSVFLGAAVAANKMDIWLLTAKTRLVF